jgi:MFS family permease
VAVLFAATWFMPRHTAGVTSGRWRPKAPSVPASSRKAFAVASIAVTTAYTHGVLILSFGGQVAQDLVGSSNALTNGAALSSFAIVSAAIGIAAGRLDSRAAITLGAAISVASMGLFAMAVAWRDLPIFLMATASAGAGYSLLFLGGLKVINNATPAPHRAGTLSALYLLAYLSMGVVALLLGAVATAWGLGFAIDIGAGVIALFSVATIALAAHAHTSWFVALGARKG